MKWLALGALVVLAACSQGKQPAAQASASAAPEPTATFTPPKTKAGALLAKYAGATGPYAPRDECAGLDGAEDFRVALANAVVKRDDDALIQLTDPHVRLDFGEGHGADLLRKRLDSPIFKLWDEIAAILPLGCSAQGKDALTIPWFFSQDFGKLNPYNTVIVTGQDVPVFDEPNTSSKIVGRVSWNVLQIASNDASTEYTLVELPPNKENPHGVLGYVGPGKLRDLLAYRLLANKTADGWKITGLVAGD